MGKFWTGVARFVIWLLTSIGQAQERQRQADAGRAATKEFEDIARDVDALDDARVQEELDKWRRP